MAAIISIFALPKVYANELNTIGYIPLLLRMIWILVLREMLEIGFKYLCCAYKNIKITMHKKFFEKVSSSSKGNKEKHVFRHFEKKLE
jgi:hypothetical protein